MNAAISIDDELVADAFPTLGFVPTVNVGNGVVLAFGGGTTMDDDFGYLSHSFERIPLIRHRIVIRKPLRQMPKQNHFIRFMGEGLGIREYNKRCSMICCCSYCMNIA